MTLNEYKHQEGHTYESLGSFLNRPWRTVTDWCEKGYTIEFEGNFVKVMRPEKMVHKARWRGPK